MPRARTKPAPAPSVWDCPTCGMLVISPLAALRDARVTRDGAQLHVNGAPVPRLACSDAGRPEFCTDNTKP